MTTITITSKITPFLILAAFLATIASCAVSPSATSSSPEDDTTQPLVPVVTLGAFEGSFDGRTFEIHALTATTPGSDVAGDVQALLPVVPSTAFGSGTEPTGTDFIALTAPTPRLTETTWNTTNCGPTPAGGVCMNIVMRNMYSRYLLQTPFVQFTSLTPVSPTTNVAFRSNAMSNASFGTDSAIGLISYPPLLPAGTALSFGTFHGPSGPCWSLVGLYLYGPRTYSVPF